MRTEPLKALSARLRVALVALDAGDNKKAQRVLQGLVMLLPAPDRRHWEAANKGE